MPTTTIDCGSVSCKRDAEYRVDFGEGSVGTYCERDMSRIKDDAAREGWEDEIVIEELTAEDHERKAETLRDLALVVEVLDLEGLSLSEMGDYLEIAADYCQDRENTVEEAVDTLFGQREDDDE